MVTARKNELSGPSPADVRRVQGLVREILSVFLERASERVLAAQEALERRDMVAVAVQARAIVRFADKVGAVAIRDMACMIEDLSRSGDTASVACVLEEMDDLLIRQVNCLDVASHGE
jgi:hypothetical protein